MLFSIKKKDNSELLSISVTQEIKGLAILGVVFSHIGYFLSTNHDFLFPLSIIAGISVDTFLFLSGFGLTISALRKDISVTKFYKKNFLKLYIPFWISIIFFFILNFFIVKTDYSFSYIIKSLLGIFTTADIFKDINSPLWYFTFILFYYLIFPIVFSKKYPWVSAIIIYSIYLIINGLNLNIINSINGLHAVHTMAFPIGILAGWILSKEKVTNFIKEKLSKINNISYFLVSLVPLTIFILLSYFSGIGHGNLLQQITSIIAMISIVIFFAIKKIKIKLLYIFGLYSFEIYLIHWPIMYHYDIFYKYTPAWFATILYLIIFLFLGFLLKKISTRLLKQ